jgi:PPOX class probable F420-dependent enzyme
MVRKDIAMTAEEIRAFIESGHTLQVATIGRDGRPHLAPMWYLPRGNTVAFRSFTKSQKIVNLRRDPRLTVLIETGNRYEELRGLMIHGTAELQDDRDLLLDAYVELAIRYDNPPGAAAMGSVEPAVAEQLFGRFADKNTYVHVLPERVVSWDHAKLAGVY